MARRPPRVSADDLTPALIAAWTTLLERAEAFCDVQMDGFGR